MLTAMSVLLERETACPPRDSGSVQAGRRAGRSTPMPARAHAATKPEVNLDCVPAAARGCAQPERPQKISTTRL